MAAPARRAAGRPLLVTHDGKFHCDEVFAYAVLRHALELHADDHDLVRTREPDPIARATIVWDVGSRFDPAAGRFDHHQRGAPTRPDGTPFSAAGLVWQVHGEAAVLALCGTDACQPFAARIASLIDDTIVRSIDLIDNGITAESSPVALSGLIDDLNPTWDAPRDPGLAKDRFLEAADLASNVLRRRVQVLCARVRAESEVVAALARAEDPRILTLDQGLPWKSVVHERGQDVMFCVAPSQNGNWTVYAVPSAPDAMDQKSPLPAAWAGLEGEALVAASGVPDAVFVHLRRFMGAARTRSGAIAMARAALGEAVPKPASQGATIRKRPSVA